MEIFALKTSPFCKTESDLRLTLAPATMPVYVPFPLEETILTFTREPSAIFCSFKPA